jgi:integrase
VSKRERGNGAGTIYQRAGRKGWYVAVTVAGRRKVYHVDSKTEATRLLSHAITKRDGGELVAAPAVTVKAFLEQWLEQTVKPSTRPGTYVSYEHLLRLHAYPKIGHLKLDRLTPGQVQEMLNAELAEGLSPRSVQYLRTVLRSALSQAQRWGLVTRNVAQLVDAPKVERHEISPFTLEEAQAFLAAAAGDRLEALWSVALAMGLRQGEALGLRWPDVDLDEGLLHVRQQLQRVRGGFDLAPLKTSRSRRTVAMPPAVADALRRHRIRQIEERLLARDRWRGPEPNDPRCHVFTTPIGTPVDARNLVRLFKALLARAGLRDVRFHDLRHAAATLLMAQGVPARVVMEILGHSQIALTLNTYSHVLPELQRDAAARMEAALFAP